MSADDYGQFLQVVKDAFGYDIKQSNAIARSQLSSLRQTGTLVEFFADFDSACLRAGVNGDEPKITMLMEKLKPRYWQMVVDTGVIPEKYPAVRKRLLNVSAMEMQAVKTPLVQGKGPASNATPKGRRKRNQPNNSATIKVEAKN